MRECVSGSELIDVPLLLCPLLQRVHVAVEQPLQINEKHHISQHRQQALTDLPNQRHVTWSSFFKLQPCFVVGACSWVKREDVRCEV